MAFKNNLFWKNYGYDLGYDNINSNYGPNWDFNCGGTVCAAIQFAHNFNRSGVEVDPKFISEGSYGNPHINKSNVEWYWGPRTPDGSDITTLNVEPDLRLQSNSPAIDQGTYLVTATNSAATPSNILVVGDAMYFQPGWGNGAGGGANVQADWIAIGNPSNTAQIASIDYDTNAITLASPMTWSKDAPIWLYKNSSGQVVLHGANPDAGAHEFTPQLTLQAQPANRAIHLSWTVDVTLPVTVTWQIDYASQTGSAYLPITGLISTTRAYTCFAQIELRQNRPEIN